jgi:uncharacterized protein
MRQVVAVIGASRKPERYAFRAFELLREYGHRPIPVNPAFAEISGQRCYPRVSDVPGPIDTITLYLRKSRSDPLVNEIISAAPRRIIMNPGAENPDLRQRAEAAGIEVVEGCTMVMLRSRLF